MGRLLLCSKEAVEGFEAAVAVDHEEHPVLGGAHGERRDQAVGVDRAHQLGHGVIVHALPGVVLEVEGQLVEGDCGHLGFSCFSLRFKSRQAA